MSRKPVAARSAGGRSKERFTLWLAPETHAALKALAGQRKMATSIVAEGFIRDGLGLAAQERLEGPALPAVRRVVEEVIGRQGERLARLVARKLVEAGVDRRLTYALLDHHAGAETARTIYAAAERAAVAGLRRRLGEEREP